MPFSFVHIAIDYLPFLEPEQMTMLPNMQDISSPPITIMTGLPFGNSIQHIAYVRIIIANYNLCFFINENEFEFLLAG